MPEAIEVYDGMKQRWNALNWPAGQVVKPCKYEAELDAASKELEKLFDMPVGLLCVSEGIRTVMTRRDAEVSILWRLARLMRNTDELNVTAFGVQGGNLLAELMALDPDEYEKKVRGNIDAN